MSKWKIRSVSFIQLDWKDLQRSLPVISFFFCDKTLYSSQCQYYYVLMYYMFHFVPSTSQLHSHEMLYKMEMLPIHYILINVLNYSYKNRRLNIFTHITNITNVQRRSTYYKNGAFSSHFQRLNYMVAKKPCCLGNLCGYKIRFQEFLMYPRKWRYVAHFHFHHSFFYIT